MNRKTLIWICVLVFGAIGGYVPMLWGEGMFSMNSVILTGVFGFIGIYVGYKISQML